MSIAITEKINDLQQKTPASDETADVSPESGETAAQKGGDSEAYKISFSDEALDELSDAEQRKVEELKKIDRNVHVHELAHLSAAGGYARGGASFEYATGPDGKRYATAGHVNLDVGREKTPEATIRKAEVVRRAALAPADPSPADRQIAANAAKMAQEAQREIAEQQQAKGQKTQKQNSKQNSSPEQQKT